MTISDQIIQVLDALCKKFGMVIDWTSANVMPYLAELCTKLVTWEIWTSVAWMAIMAVACIAWIIILRVFRLAIKTALDEGDVLGPVVFIISGILFGATIACVGTQIFDIIKCVTFPEMFVFEYIQKLINSSH